MQIKGKFIDKRKVKCNAVSQVPRCEKEHINVRMRRVIEKVEMQNNKARTLKGKKQCKNCNFFFKKRKLKMQIYRRQGCKKCKR